MNNRQTKIQKLKLEIQVKDSIIAALINVISKNNIKVPSKVLSIIEALYVKKEEKKEEVISQ